MLSRIAAERPGCRLVIRISRTKHRSTMPGTDFRRPGHQPPRKLHQKQNKFAPRGLRSSGCGAGSNIISGATWISIRNL